MRNINILEKKSKKDISIFYFSILLFLYRLTLDFIYIKVISPVWEYQHFILDIDNLLLLYSYIWMLLIALYDYKLYKDNRPSSIFLFFTDLLFFIPLSSIAPLAGFSPLFFYFALSYWIIMAYMQNKRLAIVYERVPFNTVNPTLIFYLISSFFIVLNLCITIYYNGFHIKFDLNDIYDIRYAVRDMHLPVLVNYIKPLASKITLLVITVMIIKKKYTWLIILTLIQLTNFAFGALKSDLFALLIAYIIGFVYKPHHRVYLLYGLIAANIWVIIEYYIFDVSLTSIVIHRRVLFMPGLLSFEYYEFFSSNECVYLRDSFMRYFGMQSPYDLEVPRLIGSVYYGNGEANCNTGIVGDDFAQLGWLSLFIFPFLRIKLMKLYDFVSNKTNESIMVFISFIYSLVFISGTMFSSLLTGGFFGICLLLYLLKNKKND